MARDFTFSVRDKVVAALEGISDIGVVMDPVRFMAQLDDIHTLLKSTIDSVDQVRFWIVDVPSVAPRQIATMVQSEPVEVRIFGYIGLASKPGTAATVSGTATSGGSTTLTDGAQSWSTNAYADKYAVWLTGGTGDGQYRLVSSNTATQLTVSRAWSTNPASGTTYEIWPQPSEFTLWKLAYDVIDALSADRSLTSTAGVVSTLPQATMEPWIFMDVLCHRVTITFTRGRAQGRSYT